MSKKSVFWSVVGVLLSLILISCGLVYFIPSWRNAAIGLIKKEPTESETKPNNNELLEYQNKVKELNSKIDKLNNEKNVLVSEIELKTKEHEANISALNEQLTNKQNELVTAQNRLVELQNDISANVSEIERLQGEIEALTGDKQILENQIEQLNSEYEEQVNNLNNQIENLETEKNNLQKQFDDYKFADILGDYNSNFFMFFNQNFISNYDLNSIGTINSSEIYNSFDFSKITNYSSAVRIRFVLPNVVDFETGSGFSINAYVKVPYNKSVFVNINNVSSDFRFYDFLKTSNPIEYKYSITGGMSAISFKAIDFYIYITDNTPILINGFNFCKNSDLNSSFTKISYLPFGVSEIEYFGDSSLINFDSNLVYNYLPDNLETYGSFNNLGEIVVSNK